MLGRIYIKNYILIDELDIVFLPGMSVITGETGSGKSILLGALGLILGQRAETDVLLDQNLKCVIEGVFHIGDYNLEHIFRDNDLDYDPVLILRREILPSGKSRAFINDSPVTLPVLKSFSDRLVNIHSQNSITTLHKTDFQLDVIDHFAGHMERVSLYRQKFRVWNSLKKELVLLEQEEAEANRQADYDSFLLNELDQASMVPGELAELERMAEMIRHADDIKKACLLTHGHLTGNDINILVSLSESVRAFQSIEKFDPRFKELATRLNINYVDLKDLAGEIASMADDSESDTVDAEKVNQRLDLLYRLLKKHHKHTVEELIDLKKEIENKLVGFSNLNEKIKDLTKTRNSLETELKSFAQQLSETRLEAAPRFAEQVSGNLAVLGLPHGKLIVAINPGPELTEDGMDRIEFLFSANKGKEARDLAATASGGELSRLMLCIKSMIGRKNLLPTIVFDEIDNGVSGEVAAKVGSILNQMGTQMQVIVISHLPQIAVKADQHFRVFKSEGEKGSRSHIHKLNENERIEEVARMLSNEVVTEVARNAARELLAS